MQSSRSSSTSNKSPFRSGSDNKALPSTLSSSVQQLSSKQKTFEGFTTLSSLDTKSTLISKTTRKAATLKKKAPVKSAKTVKKKQAAKVDVTKNENDLDDFDLMICHEDFAKLVNLSEKVKAMKLKLSSPTASLLYAQNAPHFPNNSLLPDDVLGAVELMKERHAVKGVLIQQGRHPLTDEMMQDNFTILQRELDHCERCLQAAKSSKKTTPSKRKPIANKYSKAQTDVLMNWMVQHFAHPFPNPSEIEQLAKETGLTEAQVVNWTTNVRKRNRKATLEENKKPHHFIDYLFLAHDRDKQAAAANQASTAFAGQESDDGYGENPGKPMRLQEEGTGFNGYFSTPEASLSRPLAHNPYQQVLSVAPSHHPVREHSHLAPPQQYSASPDSVDDFDDLYPHIDPSGNDPIIPYVPLSLGHSQDPAILNLFAGGWSEARGAGVFRPRDSIKTEQIRHDTVVPSPPIKQEAHSTDMDVEEEKKEEGALIEISKDVTSSNGDDAAKPFAAV